MGMKDIFVVTIGAKNKESMFQFAFEDLEDAKTFRDQIDSGKGASSEFSTIHILKVYAKGEWKDD
jgi:hypothetical protein